MVYCVSKQSGTRPLHVYIDAFKNVGLIITEGAKQR